MSPSRREDLPKQQELRTTTAERLEAIVEAAERAAQSVIDDAEAQARRYLAQARAEADRAAEGRVAELSDLVDSLLGQAVSVRREAERLQASLEAARSQIDSEQPQEAQESPVRAEDAAAPKAPRLRAVAGSEQSPAPAEPRPAGAAGARLLATQMAVSGSSREEIAERLRNGFDIEDTTAILDAILGPEAPEE